MASVLKIDQKYPYRKALWVSDCPPNVVAVDPFVDFPMYVVPFFEVDTLQEWGGKAFSVELSII